ncbi:hypothetical protein EV383_4755 [Pseudonocardia sediminis]|uniref:Uncharacterized protein n=1 Tax=Pseudonocardia sediminis TaxID=1397368 RepID=A0A4Q7V2T0_PSEST|nr:hypothetical protein [Pseudonocardia sediminis]RZT87828.1 hypothetical protein EV383_4755 [Pseudonocardia sediminis]
MPFFRRKTKSPEAAELSKPAPIKLPVDSNSAAMNTLAKELNELLPDSTISGLAARTPSRATSVSDGYEHERGLKALDWLTRTWFTTWCRIIPESGDTLASKLRSLPPIRDRGTALAVGNFVGLMSDTPEENTKFIEANYDRDKLYERIALAAAEKASSEAYLKSVGPAIADIAASHAIDEFRAARADVALAAISSLAFSHSLDEVWPFIVNHANLPGDTDAKTKSIQSLAPHAARQPFTQIVSTLQTSSTELYADLIGME